MSILGIGLIIVTILLSYFLFQFYRNNKVFLIRVKWIRAEDERYEQYSYDSMYDPSKSNWWGLKIPKEKHFK